MRAVLVMSSSWVCGWVRHTDTGHARRVTAGTVGAPAAGRRALPSPRGARMLKFRADRWGAMPATDELADTDVLSAAAAVEQVRPRAAHYAVPARRPLPAGGPDARDDG